MSLLPARTVRTRGGSVVGWNALAVTPAALVDPGSLTTGGTGHNSSTGRLTIAYGAHTTLVDGYQEGLARYTYPLLSLVPDFDPAQDLLELGIDSVSWGHNTVETGFFIGLLDSTTVDASLAGAVMSLRSVSAGADQAGIMNATTIPSFSQADLLDGCQCSIQLGSDGTNYPSNIRVLALIEGTTRWQQIAGVQGQTLRSPVSNWVVAWGGWHGSTDNCTGVTQLADLVWRRRRTNRPFP